MMVIVGSKVLVELAGGVVDGESEMIDVDVLGTVVNELLKVVRRFAPSRYSRLLKCMHSHASASVYKDCSNSECHRNIPIGCMYKILTRCKVWRHDF